MNLFDPAAYGAEVKAILDLDAGGSRLMPLAGGACSSEAARERIRRLSARQLFPRSKAPEAALAGLYLYFSCRQEAHQIAQDLSAREGSYWHAIVHRQEPDPWNSEYWFRQVGLHPIFPALCESAAEVGVSFGPRWDPLAFIRFCEDARLRAGSDAEQEALLVQRAEWRLLFDYCAAPARQ